MSEIMRRFDREIQPLDNETYLRDIFLRVSKIPCVAYRAVNISSRLALCSRPKLAAMDTPHETYVSALLGVGSKSQ